MKVPELSGPLMDKAVEEARRLIASGETIGSIGAGFCVVKSGTPEFEEKKRRQNGVVFPVLPQDGDKEVGDNFFVFEE